jgi:UDP-N-acetyl-D-galactosamine dehydrogenase
VSGARVGILGLTFKENVSDLLNSKDPDIVRELGQFGIRPLVHDAMCAPDEALREYGITLCRSDELTDLDGLILAVPHAEYLDEGPARIVERLKSGGALIDVKSVIPPGAVPPDIRFWSL